MKPSYSASTSPPSDSAISENSAYIRRELVPRGIDTVYVLGNAANKELFAEVAREIDDVSDVHRTHKYKASLRDPQGAEFEARQALLILRRRGAPVFQPS